MTPRTPTVKPCTKWADHEWPAPRVVEAGTHPLQGRFTKFSTTCPRCGKELRFTEWHPKTIGAAS